MTRKQKVVLGVLGVVGSGVILAIIYAILLGPQTAAVLLLKQPLAKHPEMHERPRPLALAPTARLSGRRLSYFGYDFEAPWTDLQDEHRAPSLARISFKSGKGIVVFNPAQAVDLLDELRQKHPEYAEQTAAVFGPGAMKSNFALYQAILSATPDELRIFMPKADAVRLSILLILKRILAGSFEPGVYTFTHQDFRGFQFGDPARTNKVMVHVFDEQDERLELLLFVTKNSSAALSQREISHVIRSLRRAA